MPVKDHGEAIAIISINDLDGLTWRQALAIALDCNLQAPNIVRLGKINFETSKWNEQAKRYIHHHQHCLRFEYTGQHEIGL